jgi:fibrillarin-like rRNA methylase
MRNQTNRPKQYKTRSYIQKAIIANRRLRNGDITLTAERTGYSITHVSDVVSGKQFNTRIMNHIFNMARNRKQNAEIVSEIN